MKKLLLYLGKLRKLFSKKLASEKFAGLLKPDRLLIILALIVLVVGVSRSLMALGKSGGAPLIRRPVLVFTQWWQGEMEAGFLEALADEFEEKQGNLKIVLDFRPKTEIEKLLLNYHYGDETENKGGEPEKKGGNNEKNTAIGDILALDPLWTSGLYENQVLEKPPEELITFFYPLFYNIEILKNAGFSRPPKTRKEFLSFAAGFTGPDVYAIAFALGESNPWGIHRDIYPWFWAADISLAGASLTDGGKGAEETLAFFSSLNTGGHIHPASFSLNEEEKREAFIRGNIAFMTGAVQDIGILKKEMGENAFGLSALPGLDSGPGKPVFGASAWSVGVFRQSAHQEEAEAFIAFLKEKSALLAEKAGAVPGAGNSLSPELMKDPFYSKAWELYIAGDLVRVVSSGLSSAEQETIFHF